MTKPAAKHIPLDHRRARVQRINAKRPAIPVEVNYEQDDTRRDALAELLATLLAP